MLKSYSIEHYRAIERTRMELKKSKIDYRNNYVMDGEIVNPAVFYGNNGTGKSLALNPFGILTFLLNYEPSALPSRLLVFPDVLELQEESPITEFPTFAFDFVLDGIPFTYEISLLGKKIMNEKLTSKNLLLFSRKKDTYLLEKQENPVSEYYPALRKIGIEEYSSDQEYRLLIKKVYDYLSSIVYIDSNGNVFGKEFREAGVFDTIHSMGKSFEEHLNKILSIPNITFSTKINEKTHEQEHYVTFLDAKKDLHVGFASEGMMQTLRLVLVLESSLKMKNRPVVVDELDRSLHPIALKKTIDEFVEKGIQLIFACHDTNLMRYLRPDQVYFSYFGENLHTTIHRLNDIFPRLREINSIETMYLKGVFDDKLVNAANKD